MKKLLISVLTVIAIVAAADVCIGRVLDTALSAVPDAGTLETDEHQALFNREPQVLLLGSSRTKHEYDPQAIGQALDMTCYNAGIDGHAVNYCAIILESVVSRGKPDIVTLDLLAAMMDGSWSRTGLATIMPYYGINKPLTAYVDRWSGKKEHLKLHSNLYRLNGVCPWLAKACLKGSGTIPTDGYAPYYGTCGQAEYILSDEFTPAPNEVYSLDRIVELCRDSGTRLVVFVSPNYDVNTAFNAWVAAYCDRQGIEFHDFSFDNRFTAKLFIEPHHLNSDGARLYTGLVIDCLQRNNVPDTIAKP